MSALNYGDNLDIRRCYLTMMSSRPVELRRVLKSSSSLYLHCDPTASHYVKLLLGKFFVGKQTIE